METPQPKKVGCLLAAGIFLIPQIFSWFTLRNGHSVISRIIAIGWMLFCVASCTLVMVAPSVDKRETITANIEGEHSFKIGDKFDVGDYTYCVSKVSAKNSIGNEMFGKKASEDAIFVIVSYSIRNNTNKTQTVLANDFKLIDARGREFASSSEASSAYGMSGGNNEFIVSQLQPGITKKTATVFEIQNDAADDFITIKIPEKGWGSGAALIMVDLK